MSTLEEIRTQCENDLFTFAQCMFPNRYYGDLHKELFNFFQHGDGDCKLALVPRDHQKSHCIAVYVAWKITIKPWVTFTYVSANPRLAEKQLGVIKQVLMSEEYNELWPEMLNWERDRTGAVVCKPKGTWTKSEIEVDHPLRKEKQLRDPTVWATSAKSTNTGFHFDEVVFDDLVTNENYRSHSEKIEVLETYQSFSSIATTGPLMWAVGTRYGEDDLYAHLLEMEYEVFDTKGNVKETIPMWNVFERVVENSKNRTGTGEFAWPKMQMPNGSWYGFDATELSKKKAHAGGNLVLFGAQYYNDPNFGSANKLSADNFMYWQPSMLENRKGKWYYGSKELRLNAGMDLAFSEGSGLKKKKRDYTAVAVTAWDEDGYLYILDLKRFQTDKNQIYAKEVLDLWQYWGFKEITVETNAGGKPVANYIQDAARQEGSTLVVQHQHKNQTQGSKEERNTLLLEPLYLQKTVFHKKGGYTRQLEEELKLARPAHDDLTDALYISISTSKRMSRPKFSSNRSNNTVIPAQGRFLTRTRRRA